MDEVIQLNPAQFTSIMLDAPNKVDVWGRGTGKSSLISWDIHNINRRMPRAVTAVTGQTYGQLLTRTLPSTFKFLEKLGYVRDENYVIGKRPPKHFITPYEKIMKHDNFISFSNGNGLLLLSQDRAGSARGPNVDYEIVDEALTLNKDRYDEETKPTNRGNRDKFGTLAKHPVPIHHGYHYVSSMPYTADGKWLLEYGKYYEEEAGIRYFHHWNQIVKLQLELLKCEDPKDFQNIWNEINRQKAKFSPFVSKNGTLFTLANAFDNIANLGLKYIRDSRDTMTELTFLVEIMNLFIETVEDCYYSFNPDKHIYYNAFDEQFLRDYAEDTNWDWNKLGSPDSRFDSDILHDKPLELVFDFGSSVSFMLVCQENNLITKFNSFKFLREFFSKPQRGRVMIDDLIDNFCEYYSHHRNKIIFYYKDKYGDARIANNSQTYNEQAIDRLAKNGWTVHPIEYKGMEPPHHEKYLLWGNITKEYNPDYPIVRINGSNCPHFILAANNTMVKERNGKFEKDKTSEKKGSGIAPEDATHSTDAADKIIWVKYGNVRKNRSHIPVRK